MFMFVVGIRLSGFFVRPDVEDEKGSMVKTKTGFKAVGNDTSANV